MYSIKLLELAACYLLIFDISFEWRDDDLKSIVLAKPNFSDMSKYLNLDV